jgi:hypothetical protein
MSETGLQVIKDFKTPNGMGLRYPPSTPIETWMADGEKMWEIDSFAREVLPLFVGDWLIEGRKNYGHSYSQALDVVGHKIGSLRNSVWVCSKIPWNRRRSDTITNTNGKPKLIVGYSHYQELAPLEPEKQDYWLEQIVQNQWNSTTFRAIMKTEREKVAQTTVRDPETGKTDEVYVYSEDAGAEFEAWLVQYADLENISITDREREIAEAAFEAGIERRKAHEN